MPDDDSTEGWLTCILPDPPQMRKPETGRIFQAVAERAVEADMRQPDRRERLQQRRGEAKTRDHQRDRPQGAVGGVVDDRAPAGATEVAREAEVRRQEQDEKDPPGAAPHPVE